MVAMLRVAGVPDIWWEVLPEQARQLPRELARIDAFLDDERFIAPWRAVFAERLGRPSVPVETLLRLLYLKHRYQLGYETLCREVADSLSWRRFCPDPVDLSGAALHHADQTGTPQRPTDRGTAQCRAAGEAGRGQAAAVPQAAHRHHRGRGRHRPPHGRRSAGARGAQAGPTGAADQGRGRRQAHPFPGPQPVSGPPLEGDLTHAAAAHRPGYGRDRPAYRRDRHGGPGNTAGGDRSGDKRPPDTGQTSVRTARASVG
ncbi:hypothetical protein B1C81_05315 [Streptomyces sp. HG99]|nr:hypothetical protein B1C81_05315 [Streptomyces sp. HG99]